MKILRLGKDHIKKKERSPMVSTDQSIRDLQQDPVFAYFEQLCQIPHPSFGEKDLSDWILNWAKNLGLDVEQDEKHNLWIQKKEKKNTDRKPILLQAHLDMVCEKDPDIAHDFKKDPIHLELEGDRLSTGNRTTLGADNGIGVAMAMAILAMDDRTLPPIGVLLTTAEEEDMSGALHVSKEWLLTDRIINLDNSMEDLLISGSSGGCGARLTLPVAKEPAKDDQVSIRIRVSGLKGGHSGEDIHRGLGNANKILGRILYHARKESEFQLAEIRGGSFRLAIPREAEALIALGRDEATIVHQQLTAYVEELKSRYDETEPELSVSFSDESQSGEVCTLKASDQIIETILLSPSGIFDMHGDLGVVESSCNLGEMAIEDDSFSLVTEIRATYELHRHAIFDQIECLARKQGGEATSFAAYPSWIYRSQSPLRELAQSVHRSMYGCDMKNMVVHAGLECGCFSSKLDDMDAISIGPNIFHMHSPKEWVSVSSTQKVFAFLLEILRQS